MMKSVAGKDGFEHLKFVLRALRWHLVGFKIVQMPEQGCPVPGDASRQQAALLPVLPP